MPNSTSTPPDYTLIHNLQSQSDPKGKSKIAHSSAEAEQWILQSALDTLHQPIQMLRDGVVKDQHLSAKSSLVPGSTVGKHLRHVHDHYRLLLSSLQTSSTSSTNDPPEIDYDQRPPAPSLETSAQACLKEFQDISNSLKGLIKGDGSWYERECIVRATTPNVMEFKSSVGRELWFVSLHSIHHYALARAILTRELGLGDVLSSNFGLAPSTIVHRAWKSNEKSKL